MGHGERSGAARGSKEWECPCCGENFKSEGEEEWPIGKVCNKNINTFFGFAKN